MTLICRLLLLCFIPLAAMAEAMEQDIFLEAGDLTPEEFHWVKRPVLVFADTPADPSFLRQMELLRENPGALIERDVVVITDTDPAALSAFRRKFRPRGFSLVMMDKDGITTLRKPLPWDVREITRAIDKFPIARQEMQERFPSGR
ncbi:DUF4174 domain-containing protein [Szabonella alba]|uniref:DUF4174 domain-containing protein n=1 Tax=Szabonella alba TaxID=2804194 RepID=A0A8K0XZN5_9RHOB|nr:DUF4174 domain-containing protein [Szabonella alba]MBL4915977.1 DUF4174 domain-containing protein [Szabonella alba]